MERSSPIAQRQPAGEAAPPPEGAGAVPFIGAGSGWPPVAMPDPAAESALLEVKETLGRIAERHWGAPGADRGGARGLLDAALLCARTELLGGEPERLREEIPNFAYLLVLTLAGREAAGRAREEAARRLGEGRPAPRGPAPGGGPRGAA